jgi:hypothetical protein
MHEGVKECCATVWNQFQRQRDPKRVTRAFREIDGHHHIVIFALRLIVHHQRRKGALSDYPLDRRSDKDIQQELLAV